MSPLGQNGLVVEEDLEITAPLRRRLNGKKGSSIPLQRCAASLAIEQPTDSSDNNNNNNSETMEGDEEPENTTSSSATEAASGGSFVMDTPAQWRAFESERLLGAASMESEVAAEEMPPPMSEPLLRTGETDGVEATTVTHLRRRRMERSPSVTAVGTQKLGFPSFRVAKRLTRKSGSLGSGRRAVISLTGRPNSVNNNANESTPLKQGRSNRDISPKYGGGADGGNQDDYDRTTDGETDEEEDQTPFQVIINMVIFKPISVLLLCAPFAIFASWFDWGPEPIFWLSFFTMIPLASILGDFTEELAAHTNQIVGGLINATFGNAVEVVVAIQALNAHEIRVVQASMIGSIFSNLLLVLGGCFFFGGLKHKEQRFNSTAAVAHMSLLALSSIALVLPTPFAAYYEIDDEQVLEISRVAAIFLMFMYAQLLIFQLNTHADLFEDDGDEEPNLGFWHSLGGLTVCTLLITFFSDMLVASIAGFVETSGFSRTFVGVIILPIAANAVEHITAVSVAMKDKMDLAMGVALGSCTQISLFVIPLTVLWGWATDRPMTLNFTHFEITLFIMSVVTVSICLSNPKGNWLEGSLLMTTYAMIAMGFWFENVVDF